MSDRHRKAHEEVIVHLISSGFLSPQPRMMGVRAWSMLLPSIAQVIGGLCFGTVAWSLTELSLLDATYRINLVVFGAFAIAIGGNAGSLPVAVEVFRKENRTWIDWVTLVFSSIASWVEMIIALSFLGGFNVAQNLPRIWLMTGLAILDTTFGMSQFAAYLAGHSRRMARWEERYDEAVEREYNRPALEPEPEPEPKVYEIPTGEHARARKIPEPITVSKDGNGGLCWCGRDCKNFHAYNAHVGHSHHYETLYSEDGERYTTGREARDAMLARYADTLSDARWEFPTLDKVREMRRKAVKKWPEPGRKSK